MDAPNIAEKVKFWEEQDRINLALIPRLLKTHELLSEHVEGHQDVATNLASLEARMAAKITQTRVQAFTFAGASLAVAIFSIVLIVVV